MGMTIGTPLSGTAETSTARSGLSWAAVFGGAAVASAVTVMLLALGTGIGLGSVSPNGANPSAATFTALAAVWLIIVQWVSSFFGGYLAGRLRPGWTGLAPDETVFRDTATGFVAWAVATLLVVGVVASGTGNLLGAASHAAAARTGGGAPDSYLVDTLFRADSPGAVDGSGTAARTEAGTILAHAATGPLGQDDRTYLAKLVAARTGLSTEAAGQRVDTVAAEVRQAANASRKAAASFSVYTFFSMLVGAFIACVAGAIGGRQRDRL